MHFLRLEKVVIPIQSIDTIAAILVSILPCRGRQISVSKYRKYQNKVFTSTKNAKSEMRQISV